ncbi:hypothetical protein HNV10_16880 [Winogradskyella litoriviva]|uniref:Uncharacterized protein n=1 Tax=Winogradskyella litoriviva TaxID=1220182 RepID=A0ABX2E993_9FLAO|nr:hypothetical protein [Winogradskyella litoriviva]NRD24932.1 hypothetical protein [Winogradskyella litoriviva]
MTSEMIELIDTIVKIGLGALIASLTNYLITRYNHKSEEKKEFIRRYILSIDKISENAEEYFQKWSVLTSAIGGTSKQTTELNRKAKKEEWNFIFTADENLLDSRNNKMTALSKLKLLSLNNVADILENCTKIEVELREMVIFNDIIPKNSELDIYEMKMEKLREKFYKELSKYYVQYKIPTHNNVYN